MTRPEKLTVFYDGACPLCDREISFYRSRRGAENVSWVDVSGASEGNVVPGLSKDQALARFHVMEPNGTLVSGGRAFAELWAALPGFRTWGRLFRNRPLTWLLNHAYDLFLGFRPKLQAMMAARDAKNIRPLPAWLVRDLRSDHAGETGAVAIYRGMLAISWSNEIRSFAEAHLQTEYQHLELIETILPRNARSVFLPLWRIAGFVTGAISACFGAGGVFATIEAVETFVDRHYAQQVQRLCQEGTNQQILALLERCREDEARHRDEAREALNSQPGVLLKGWCRLVGAGSAVAVAMARRF